MIVSSFIQRVTEHIAVSFTLSQTDTYKILSGSYSYTTPIFLISDFDETSEGAYEILQQ